MKKLIFGFLYLIATSSNAASYSESGDEYLGLYQKWEKIPYEQEGGTIYRNMPQSILIKRIAGNDLLRIDINTVAANGNSCEYSGTGRWYKSKDRFEFSNTSDVEDDPISLCKLVVMIKNASAYVVTQTAGCQISCGVRNSLDGWIIKKSE